MNKIIKSKMFHSSLSLFHKKRNKTNKNKTNKQKTNKNKTNKKPISHVWQKFGFVYHPTKNKYVRLGSTESFHIIQNILTRNQEWKKRDLFMSKGNGIWANKMKSLL